MDTASTSQTGATSGHAMRVCSAASRCECASAALEASALLLLLLLLLCETELVLLEVALAVVLAPAVVAASPRPEPHIHTHAVMTAAVSSLSSSSSSSSSSSFSWSPSNESICMALSRVPVAALLPRCLCLEEVEAEDKEDEGDVADDNEEAAAPFVHALRRRATDADGAAIVTIALRAELTKCRANSSAENDDDDGNDDFDADAEAGIAGISSTVQCAPAAAASSASVAAFGSFGAYAANACGSTKTRHALSSGARDSRARRGASVRPLVASPSISNASSRSQRPAAALASTHCAETTHLRSAMPCMYLLVRLVSRAEEDDEEDEDEEAEAVMTAVTTCVVRTSSVPLMEAEPRDSIAAAISR